jgi:DNA-binding response OmpR family regulator
MDLSALRILLVDDNLQAVEILRSVLGAVGARGICHANTEVEAFRALGEETFDLVIVDQNLGRGGEGLELVRRIRKDPRSPSPFMPVIMLTAYSEERRVRAARDAGVSEFLVKPFTATGLLLRIESLVLRPRNFIRTEGYFGPDRRRRADPGYRGPERRREG